MSLLTQCAYVWSLHECGDSSPAAQNDTIKVEVAQSDTLTPHPLTANLFSSHPRQPSAMSASSAAGTGPARTSPLSTLATPRKISSPRPPAPIATGVVDMLMRVTHAVR